MFKVGDEVLVKAEIMADDGRGGKQIKLKGIDGFPYAWFEEYELIPADKTYTQGLADAWELAKKILEMRGMERDNVFKLGDFANILEFVTPEEAIAKIEAYEREKEIKVGDVVESTTTQRKFLIVTEETDNSDYDFGVIDLETMMIDRICNDTKHFKKTDKHIDIESLLRQIGE